jgi:preprotein translocase subunit SecA
MQHLENMSHLREGIHWMSVGQRDPLVEYRRQGQRLFEEMQTMLRHEVVGAVFTAQPVDPSDINQPTETELTRAARRSVSNIDQIMTGEEEFKASDFTGLAAGSATKKQTAPKQKKKVRKAERQRKRQGKTKGKSKRK